MKKELSLRMRAVRAIMGSHGFVLITDKETLSLAELDSLTNVQAVAVMTHLSSEMNRISKDLTSRKKKSK